MYVVFFWLLNLSEVFFFIYVKVFNIYVYSVCMINILLLKNILNNKWNVVLF